MSIQRAGQFAARKGRCSDWEGAQMELNGTLGWLIARGAALLIGIVILLVIYRMGRARSTGSCRSHRCAGDPSPVGSSSADEVSKRISTIEDLLLKLLRVGVLAGSSSWPWASSNCGRSSPASSSSSWRSCSPRGMSSSIT